MQKGQQNNDYNKETMKLERVPYRSMDKTRIFSEFFRPYGVLTIIYLKPPLYGYLVITVCFLVSMESFYIFSKFNTFADKGAGDKRHVFLVHPTRVLTEN